MDGRAAVRMAAVTAPFTPINAHQHSFVTPAVSKRRQEGVSEGERWFSTVVLAAAFFYVRGANANANANQLGKSKRRQSCFYKQLFDNYLKNKTRIESQ